MASQASLTERFRDAVGWAEASRADFNRIERSIPHHGAALERWVARALEWAREAEEGAALVLRHRFAFDVVRGEPLDPFRFVQPSDPAERRMVWLVGWEYQAGLVARRAMRAAFTQAKRQGLA